MARALAILTTLAMLAMALAWAGDEALPDPTLPSGMAPLPGAAGTNGDSSIPVLHTVILREGAKPVALINDQRVELGGRFGEAKLVKVSAGEVVLAGPEGRQVLRLAPDVSKTPAADRMKHDKNSAKK